MNEEDDDIFDDETEDDIENDSDDDFESNLEDDMDSQFGKKCTLKEAFAKLRNNTEHKKKEEKALADFAD